MHGGTEPDMRVFISAGEPSGDMHAANLVRAIRNLVPEVEFVGFGGPQMARAGVHVLYPLVELAIMWFMQVFQNIGTFFNLLAKAERVFREQRPAALILVDYPGFHWHLAKAAKRQGIPVIYYVPPQLWAWAGWRVRKMRERVDLALCSLPFEPDWYAARGYPHAEYVGHPYFDELHERSLDLNFLVEEQTHVGPVVAILPGSRTQEIQRNLPVLLRSAGRLAVERSDVRFSISCLHARHAALARGIALRQYRESLKDPRLPMVVNPERVHVHAGRTPELIRLADMAWAVSGSVSLELMNEALPTVVLYKVRRFDLWVARWFIRSRYITLVNLLADEEVMPEYLVDRDVSEDLARWGRTWLNDSAARGAASDRLAGLRARYAKPGACERAANRIVDFLGARPRPSIYRGPHGRLRARRSSGEIAPEERDEEQGGLLS